MKAERWFYSCTGAVFLVTMLTGFHWFVTAGKGAAGRVIDPGMFVLDLVHGLAIAAWYVTFFVQALLIGTRNRRVHFTLGWIVVPIALLIAVTGTLVAIRSVQGAPSGLQFFGLQYSRFMLVMLTEVVSYTVFIAIGVWARKKPNIHRSAMTLAGLSLLAGATVRMPVFRPVFGQDGWVGMFGPVFCLGAALLVIRFAMTRKLDRWFTYAYAIWVILYVASEQLSLTDSWSTIATAILKV